MPESCVNNEKAYLAIIISILPLWALLTTLIVFMLLSFHRSLRTTKIYDNCTKTSANYVYHVEIRTGDTSSTYNRRRTTLTIVLFDDLQSTLARVAVPGQVIFGRKDTPTFAIEDDKYFELRVTRMWLYRATKLKKISTIRLTHTCMEPDARIMVYGVEIRSDEPDRHKQFFPVMNYITAYGSVGRQNGCFDSEQTGSISMMGNVPEKSSISDELSFVDYTVLVYVFGAIIIFMSTFEFIGITTEKPGLASAKGAIMGITGFGFAISIGLLLKYVIKRRYLLNIGTGIWAVVYYLFYSSIGTVATCLWIAATVIAYRDLCPKMYNMWILTLGLGVLIGAGLTLFYTLISWLVDMNSPPKPADPFALNDEVLNYQQHAIDAQTKGKSSPSKNVRTQSQQQQQQINLQMSQNLAPSAMPGSQWLQPSQYGSDGRQMITPYYGPPNVSPTASSSPLMYAGASVAPTGSVPPPPPQQQSPYYPNYKAAGYQHSPLYPMPTYEANQLPTSPTYYGPGHPQSPLAQQPQQQQQQQPQQQQTNQQQPSQSRPLKKVGSNESTGSTYYQQLMKNKGGVKSISQYGELLRQKKAKK